MWHAADAACPPPALPQFIRLEDDKTAASLDAKLESAQ
jgi:hypothetical protein